MLDNLMEVITKPNVIIGLILAVAALVTVIFAKKIAAKITKSEDSDKIFQISLRIKTVALVAAFAGAILAVIL